MADPLEGWPKAPTKYGWQPAKAELFKRRISAQSIATELGISSRHVENALRGKAYPCPELKTWLSVNLRMPLWNLFTPEVLRGTYNPHIGKGPEVAK